MDDAEHYRIGDIEIWKGITAQQKYDLITKIIDQNTLILQMFNLKDIIVDKMETADGSPEDR